MDAISILKEQDQAHTPLLLLDLTFAGGEVRRWATHAVTYGGNAYEARVLRHNFFEIQAMSEQGTDQIPRLTVTLANADGQMSQLERSKGFKGAAALATFVIYDLAAGEASSDSLVVFSGYWNPPDEINDLELQVTALNRMNLQRVALPPVKIQRRCPWLFPATAEQRASAANDANSPFYRCGYSPDVAGGSGRLQGGSQPYTSCGYTRQACIERGMFNHDAATTLVAAASPGAGSIQVAGDVAAVDDAIDVGGAADPQTGFSGQEEVRVTGKSGAGPFTLTIAPALAKNHAAGAAVGRPTRRFGGIEYVPEAIDVRPFGSPFFIKSPVLGSAARYNDYIPLVYGTAWTEPVITVLRNDGNLTRMEAVLSLGPISGIQRVVVNDVEIPPGVAGSDMSGSGWYNLVTDGGPSGGFDLNFTDGQGNPLGDPYGGSAYLFIAVPTKLNDGKSVPRVQVLMQGRLLETFTLAGDSLGRSFSNNTAWALLDLLKLARWPLEQIDAASFARAAAVCGEMIAATDNTGAPVTVPRFQCNLVLRQRRTAAEAILGVRNNARLFFTYSSAGKLQACVEDTIGRQQPQLPYGSNATAAIAGGWPAYAYSDTDGTILRRPDGASSVRVFHRPISDTPNRFAFEFQDAFNQYIQDSFAVDDLDDQHAVGQEISQGLIVDGIPSYDQAARVAKFHLDKSVQGNTFVELETSVKALGQQVGQIIALNYAREGWTNQLFRILRIAPQQNYRKVRITAQIHDDAWYSDSNGATGAAGQRPRQPRRNPRPPNPLVGAVPRADGDMDWGLSEKQAVETDGAGVVELAAEFAVPPTNFSSAVGAPAADLVAMVSATGGSLAGGQTLYYRVTALDADGRESAPSFSARADVPVGTNTNSVTLTGLRFDAAAGQFHIYRGLSPTKMFRIASGLPVSSTFVDTGFPAQPVAMPDPAFDHANFYWKKRLTAPATADIYSASTIGSSLATWAPNEWAGCQARIVQGTGAGQLRTIASNDGNTLTVERDWAVAPASDSIFFVEEPDWKFGSAAYSSPASFRVPNQRGLAVLVQGRAADEQDAESPEGLAVVSVWTVGGVGPGVTDSAVPPAPVFGISVPRDGTLVLAPIGFGTLANTSGITSLTFRVYYADELDPVHTTLSEPAGIAPEATSFNVASSAGFEAGDYAVIEREVVRIDSIAGETWTVTRAQHATPAAAHPDAARIDRLRTKSFFYTMEPGLLTAGADSGWSAGIHLPNVRITGAELFVTNGFGDSPATTNDYLLLNSDAGLAGSLDGLRTNRGGQFAFQVERGLVIENEPTPALPVHLDTSARDLYALVRTAPQGAPIQLTVKRNGAAYASLEIPAGGTASGGVSGARLEPLNADDLLSFDVTQVGASEPGRDLTVIVRI